MKFVSSVLQAMAVATILSLISSLSLAADMRYEVVQVPMKGWVFTANLTTHIYAPPGDGPFPLVVLNHGKADGNPVTQKDDPFYFQALEFVRRGYAVVAPTREGFGSSGGTYFRANCNFTEGARHWANSVQAAIDYARTLPYVDTTHIVVIGQSQGGITAVALGERNLPGVIGIINIAGGVRDEHCAGWQATLVRNFRELGSDSKTPTLFLYGDNDQYWGNGELSKQFFEAYREGNPNARYVDEGVFGEGDSHMVFHLYVGEKIWLPPVRQFFESLGLDWTVRYLNWHQGASVVLDNIDIVPYQDVNAAIGDGMTMFLRADPRSGRAFVIAPNGHYGFAIGKDAQAKATKYCEERGGLGCQLYALDNDLVFKGPFAAGSKTVATPSVNNP
ncbi:alpha/beta fold hydrolase [Paraburkholderia bryophila]|uniref:alpha/beta hydrolase family protein n=1 Tax=Paraburkholderia bryophila TaxID=420952 RepID=UPI00234ADF2F|nr:alpha/beta fold hydrolase [Paraburkholderia bryophila]WCM24665.1 alpha/beta fold hydrolase [Paraburkholderia bryophila]